MSDPLFGPAFTSAKATFDLLKLAVDARDHAKAQAATLELREKLFAMSDIAMAYVEKNAALVARNAALELANAEHVRAKAELEEKIRERERYPLHELESGSFAYAYQPPGEGPHEPPHYLCQPCYGQGRKTVLRHTQGLYGWVWYCAADNRHEIAAGPQSAPPPLRSVISPGID